MIRKDAEPRLHDKKQPPVIMGSLGGVPRSGMQTTAWGIAFLDWNAKWVLGYPGTNELLLALDRGEIDMTATGNLFHIRKLLATGKFKILAQTGTLQDGKLTSRAEFEGHALRRRPDEGQNQGSARARGLSSIGPASRRSTNGSRCRPARRSNYVNAYREAYAAAGKDPEFAEPARKSVRISSRWAPRTSPS